MNVLVPFTLAHDLGFLWKEWNMSQSDQLWTSSVQLTRIYAYLTEGVRELRVKIFYNGRYLAFEGQLVANMEIQSWGIDYRESDAVKLGLAYLDRNGVDAFRAFR